MADDDVETQALLNYYMVEGYYRRVQMEALNAIRKFGRDPVLMLYKGLSMLMEDRVQECIREVEEIRDMQGVMLAAIILLMSAHKSSKNVDREALTELDAKIKSERSSAGERDYYYAGIVLWHLKKHDKAREYVDRLIKNFNQPKQGLILRGWIDWSSGRDAYAKKSIKYFEEGLTNNKDPFGLIGKSRYLTRRNNFQGAMEHVNQIVVAYPNFQPAYIERMKLYLAFQDWEQTLDGINKLQSLDQHHPEAAKMQILHSLAIEGNYSDAVNQLGELIQIIDRFEPQNANLYYKCGSLFGRMCGRNTQVLAQTKTLIERALTISPTSAVFTNELAYQLFLQNATDLDESSIASLIGAIRCQLFADEAGSMSVPEQREAITDATQQLEFLCEVQKTLGLTSEMLYLTAVHARKTNKGQDEIEDSLMQSVKTHLSSLKGALSAEYFQKLNPDFVVELAKEILNMAPTQPVMSGQQIPTVLVMVTTVLEPIVRTMPGFFHGLYLHAKAKFLSGDSDSASSTLAHIVDRDATFSDAHLLLARIHQKRGNMQAASQALETAVSYNFQIRDHPLYHLIKARSLRQLGKHAEAVQTLRMAHALPGVKRPLSAVQRQGKGNFVLSSSDRIALFLELVEAHTANGEHHEAAKIMQDTINAFNGTPEEVRVTIANAELSLSRGDTEQALTMLRNIKPDQSYYVQAREKMADIYLHKRHDKKLYVGCYRDLHEQQPTLQSLVLLGDAYMNVQDLDTAIETYTKAMKQNPRDGTLASKIGQALTRTHDYKKAMTYYETALKHGQPHLKFELADLLLQMKLFDKAESVLKREDTSSAGNTELEKLGFETRRLLLLSTLYLERGQTSEAEKSLHEARDTQARVLKRAQVEQPDKAASEKTKAADICCRMAELTRDSSQAIKLYKEALIYCENDTKVMCRLAELYLSAGDLDICQQYCMQILKQDDSIKHDNASMMMADIMFRKNSYDDAIYHYRQLLEGRPKHYEALARLIGLLRRAGKLSDAPAFLGLTDQSDGDSSKTVNNDAGYNYCKGLYEWYCGKAKDALRSFNVARRDNEWGEQAISNMIRICLNPDQDTLGGEVFENINQNTSGISQDRGIEAGLKTAEKLLQELNKFYPGNPSSAINRKCLQNLVWLGMKQKQTSEKALSSYLEILQTEKDHVPSLLGMAIGYQILKQTPRARNQLKRLSKMEWSLEAADDLEQGWLLLADVYITSGKYDMATDLLKKCISHNKSCCKAFEYLGFIYEKEQSYRDAAINYEEAWRYSGKSNNTIGYKLAFNYMKAKRFIDAINVCHVVLRQNPNYPKIRKEILDKARSSIRV